MEGVLIQPSNGAWIGFQPAVSFVDPKLGWVNAFWGGSVGRVVARNFPILQIYPQFGYSTFLGVFPQSGIRWRLRHHSWSHRFYLFKGCNGCQGIHQKHFGKSLMFSHEAMPPIRQGCIYRLSHFTTFRMNGCDRGDSEDGGGRFRPCFSCFLLAQELWVHVLWILKISSSSIPANKKLPDVGLSMSVGIFYALVRSSSETERVTKVGFSCECPSDFFWLENLRLYSGYVSWH